MDRLKIVKSFDDITDYVLKNNIKGVFLDLDNTVYQYHPCHEFALFSCYKKIGKKFNLSFTAFHDLYRLCGTEVKKYNHGLAASHSRLLYFQKMTEHLLGRTDASLALKLERCYWQNFMKKMKPCAGAIDFLKKCADAKIKIILVSDLTAQIQLQKIINLKIDRYLSAVVTSEEAGAEKPDSKIYQLALQKSGLEKESIVAVGDDEAKDGGGGINFGLITYLIEI